MLTHPAVTTRVPLGADCSVALQRTLRVPDDGRDYPLPPGLGSMEAHLVGPDRYVVPMHRSEALWLSFNAPYWKPHALRIGIGGVCAVSGEPFADGLVGEPQGYVNVPSQPWLDGINAGDGFVRQFVAVPLGEGLTVEAQVTGREDEGGITFALHAPKPGRFPDEAPPSPYGDGVCFSLAAPDDEMGLGTGGRIRQEIYDDEHGIDTWEPEATATARIELVDAGVFAALTGREVPPPPDAAAYTRAGLPWFDLLAPTERDIATTHTLAGIRSIADLEGRVERGFPISEEQVVRLLGLRG